MNKKPSKRKHRRVFFAGTAPTFDVPEGLLDEPVQEEVDEYSRDEQMKREVPPHY